MDCADWCRRTDVDRAVPRTGVGVRFYLLVKGDLARRQLGRAGDYAKYGFNLIDMNDDDVHNLDDILPAKLLKFGVQAY